MKSDIASLALKHLGRKERVSEKDQLPAMRLTQAARRGLGPACRYAFRRLAAKLRSLM